MSCCDDPSCCHILVASATKEALHLSDKEREIILGVLCRDELLRRDQQYRVMHLKAELQNLRRKGALKPSADWDSTGPDPERSCGRCRVELGRVINRGAYCRACRLKVCKGCREYSFRTTDWVCTVCHKHMEIQVASGEWMNEFVRRPSRRRDNRVYVPAADIIKRTIRRSWTISNPTPRWNALRGSPELRPYNSLPRGQDISNFPSLILNRAKTEDEPNEKYPSSPRRHSPCRRTQSEDVYGDRPKTPDDPQPKRQVRINPLMRLADNKPEKDKSPPRCKNNDCADIIEMDMGKNEKTAMEKRVSFDRKVREEKVARTRSLSDRAEKAAVVNERRTRSEDQGQDSNEDGSGAEVHFAKEETAPIELCDIEPLSGTVFRKVTVRRRRQDMRKLPAVDTGWRRDTDLFDILLPEGDDYKLVFISSDSSSKEEDVDDNDSSSTASSFPIDECDWDYFEPGGGASSRPVVNWTSPVVGDEERPPVAAVETDETARHCVHRDSDAPRRQAPCQSCGAPTQFIPIPVPVPIPFPVPSSVWTQESVVLYASQGVDARLRLLPRNLLAYMSQAALIWPLISGGSGATAALREEHEAPVAADNKYDDSSSSEEEPRVQRVYDIGGGRDSDDALPSSNVTSDDADRSPSTTDTADTDTDDTGTVADRKPKRFSRTFVVNKTHTSPSSKSSETDTSDNDTDTELDCTVVLTNIKPLSEESVLDECEKEERAKNDSSPGLSDVSAESLSSSDVEAGIATLVDDEATADVVGNVEETRDEGERAGVPVAIESESCVARHAARYTSLVMITQEPAPSYQQVSVVTSDTTTLVPDNDVIVRHTNWQEGTEADEKDRGTAETRNDIQESVTVVTGGETLSAFEEGLADDDSWVENISHDEDDFGTNSDDSSLGEEVTLTCTAAIDQEDELRGYHRAAIDFTLHTIMEESCEESEVEQSLPGKKPRPPSATELEKYFFFGLGDGTTQPVTPNKDDDVSETSSIYSEGMDSLGGPEEPPLQNEESESTDLASSRLEKYFLSGFMGFTAERRDSDGSVGSDSEGRPSPEQRRKRLVRARGTGRSHSSSLDNLLANPDLANNEQSNETQNSEDSSSSDTDTYDETTNFEKSDGQFDTVKRKKNKKQKNTEESKSLDTTQEMSEEKSLSEEEDGHKTPQPETIPAPTNFAANKNQQSRDSGFIGSCDDLLREQRENNTPEVPKLELKIELENINEEKKLEEKLANLSTPPATSLTRKDSFNNWSSDEETNLMMCKMRQFFKTMVANSQCKPSTPNLNSRASPKPVPSPRAKNRCKPPQLIYFENELTRLMKTVPGIRDDQVREIVEYLSSEDTWSDSYDSSDYTSSDLEGTTSKTALQQQISESCKEIINKFDNNADDEEGDEGDGGIIDETNVVNKETAFVYQKLVASFEKIATGDGPDSKLPHSPHNSPPLIAKVMHHIGSRLVALMHEVSSGESHASNSPKARHYHRRLQQKLSSASTTTTEDDDSTSDSNFQDTLGALEDNFVPYNLLPRSKSHDLLVAESRTHQLSGGVSDIVEERGEASDCERFSWRGSFESALLATDSRNKLSLLGGEASASALAIAAKRRSAGDLLFAHKSLSREQLDRVRSCGSIGGANSEDKLWVASATRPTRRRSSVPDATCGSGGSADGEDDDEDEDEEIGTRSTLPRGLQTGTATTNSLPRLPTNTPPSSMQKAQSMYHFLPPNAKSARYRPPGFNRLITTTPKRAVSAPGLQPTTHQRRGRRSQQHNVPNDDVCISEAHSSPMLASRNGSKSATPSPVAPSSRRGTSSVSSQDWSTINADDDIDRLVAMHQTRSSLSSLGLRSDSMASVYSGAGEGRYGTVAVRGQVEFGLQYNYKAGALEIFIKQCRDLAPVDTKRNRSDPYVKVYLLPDKSKSGKRKTKVKKHTLNPMFDECLKFHISLNGLEARTLWLTVWHSDMFGRNDFLGEVMMTLENKVFDDPSPKWYNLQERTEPFDDMLSYKGDIIVCLKFVPPDMTVQKKGKRSRGTLHVLIKEAKNLTAVKANGTSDPFCKSYLLPDKGRSSKQKTPVCKRTVNPVWNHTFIYDDVTLQELAERCLELTVWDHDRLASNEFLGGVRFSLGTGKNYGKVVDWMDATGKELSLWKSMLERPNFWVEGCLSLRPSLDARGS